jgi:DNA-binding NarL/FixJ family response regulator
MAACFLVKIRSEINSNNTEIEFFNAEQWTTETEMLLMHEVNALLKVIRPLGKAVHLNLNIEVTDAVKAIFMINKKLKNECIINNQKLTAREQEIIHLIIQGYTNKEIAAKLFISLETVKSHRKHILLKTNCKNTASLIHYYHQTFFDK